MIKLLVALFICINLYGANYGYFLTASKEGTYNKVGNDIKDLFNEYGVGLEIVNTKGSRENLDILYGLEEKKASWAIVQKDAMSYFKLVHREIDNANKIYEKIKIIAPLYNEEIHILANSSQEITFDPSTKYIVNCGNENSGSCISARFIANAYNLKFIYDRSNIDDALNKLKINEIDLIFRTIGKPYDKFINLDENYKFVSLPKNIILEHIYNTSTLTNKDYSWLNEDVMIFSCPSIIVTNLVDEKYDDVVKSFYDIINKNLDYLKNVANDKWKEVDMIDDNKKYYHKAVQK